MTTVRDLGAFLTKTHPKDLSLRETPDKDAKILGTIPAFIMFSGTGRISGKLRLSVKSASDVLRPKAKKMFWFNRICRLQEKLNS